VFSPQFYEVICNSYANNHNILSVSNFSAVITYCTIHVSLNLQFISSDFVSVEELYLQCHLLWPLLTVACTKQHKKNKTVLLNNRTD